MHAHMQKVLSEGVQLDNVFFLVYEGREDTAGHHRPASETPFKWLFAGVPMMARY